MAPTKLTKRTVDAAEPSAARYALFDTEVKGFALRVYPSGEKSWVFEYKPAPGGKNVATKRLKIGSARDVTADKARIEAKRLRAVVSLGQDPQAEKVAQRQAATVAELASQFLAKHVEPKRKAGTVAHYRDILDRIVIPAIGKTKAKDLRRERIAKLHHDLRPTPFQANRVLAVLSSMFRFAATQGIVPEGTNPARGVEKYPEAARGDVLNVAELERLGAAIREAETIGVPWIIDPTKNNKHLKKTDRVTRIGEHPAAAIRLLIFTGCRLREILHLKWEHVDFERGLLLFPDHKTSRKTGTKALVLNAPAIEVLSGLSRLGVYVIAGDKAGQKDEKPRADLKKPWALVKTRAGLPDLRIHDLRHNFGSFGAGGGMGLPIIGKLLGHSKAETTQRYSHLDNDPLRRASNTIASAIAAAMGEAKAGAGDEDTMDNVVALPKRAS